MSKVNFTFAKRAEMLKNIVEKVAKELELEVSAGYDNDSEIFFILVRKECNCRLVGN